MSDADSLYLACLDPNSPSGWLEVELLRSSDEHLAYAGRHWIQDAILRNPSTPLSAILPLLDHHPWMLRPLNENPALPLYDLENPKARLVARCADYIATHAAWHRRR